MMTVNIIGQFRQYSRIMSAQFPWNFIVNSFNERLRLWLDSI